MQPKSHYLFIILLVSFFAFFIHNRDMKEGIMEARNFVTAREIVENDNWLVPTMNGELRLEKPPLPTWIAAAVYAYKGDNLTAQRSMSGLAATLLVLFFYLWVKRFTERPRLAYFSALVLLTSFYMVLMGRTATWDIYCHAFMMGAIYFLTTGFWKKGPQWGNFIMAGIFMGLSYLSKGPVAFHALLIPYLFAMFLVVRPSLRGKIFPLLVTLLFTVIIGFWWTIYLYIAEPDKMALAMNKEVVSWGNRSVKPWWYYWNFFLQTGIWAILALASMFYPLWKDRIQHPQKYLTGVLWSLFILILLSVVPKKDPRYLFPILLPLSFTVAYLLDALVHGTERSSLRRFVHFNFKVVATLIFILIAACCWMYFSGLIALTLFVFTALLFLLCGLFLLFSVKTNTVEYSLDAVVLFMVTIEILLPRTLNGLIAESGKEGIAAVRKEAYYDYPFYYLMADQNKHDAIRIELVYEAGKQILPLDVNRLPNNAFIVVTNEPFEQIALQALLDTVTYEPLAVFDDNLKNKERKIFISHITKVIPK